MAEQNTANTLEDTLSKAVEAALDRVVTETTDKSENIAASYAKLKQPILAKLLMMENEQAFEITFGAPKVATAFAAGFNDLAPRTAECLFGAFADGSILSLKRMAPVGYVISEGTAVPL